MIYLELFYVFFCIGAFTFGGGYAMLPLVQSEVAAKGWLTAQELVDFVAVSESTPGPFAVNMATYVGTEVGGILGAMCATLGVVLPSFIVILIVARCFDKFRKSTIIQGCMAGLKPAVIGMIGTAIVSVAATVFFPAGVSLAAFAQPAFYAAAAVFAVMLLLALKKLHPIAIICLSAVIGIVLGYCGVI